MKRGNKWNLIMKIKEIGENEGEGTHIFMLRKLVEK